MSILRRVQQWATFGRCWHLFDARWQDPYTSAAYLSVYLEGRHKPIHTESMDCGDHVVVINSNYIAMAGDSWDMNCYFHHTMGPQGASYTMALDIHEKDPTLIMKLAVKSALRKNLNRHGRLERLHIFADDQIPKDMSKRISHQLRQLRQVPTRLDHIPKEKVKEFPKLFDYPEDHVVR